MNTKRLNPVLDYNVSKEQKDINEYDVDKSYISHEAEMHVS